MFVNDEIKNLITQQRGSHVIKQTAVRQGMKCLREDGMQKALAGITTLEEVYRVTQDTLRPDEEGVSDARR